MHRSRMWKSVEIVSLLLLIIQISESVTFTSTSSTSTVTVTIPTATATRTSPTSSTTQTTTLSPTVSTYSNSLSVFSPTFVRPYGSPSSSYYYQAIQVTPTISATYTLRSSSSIDTYGCLYQPSFDPSNPNFNLIRCDDDSGGGAQFLITSYLQTSASYVLVVTTFNPATSGAYSVLASGPSTVYMTSIYPSTVTTRPTTTSSTSTTFSGFLYATSPVFTRPGSSSRVDYYYQAIEVTVYTYSSYSLRSVSSIDTYGCLYDTIFDPSNPNNNLLACDDDTGASQQFLINSNLQNGRRYILVVTTASSAVTGSYTVIASGSYSVTMRQVPTVQTTEYGYLSSSNPTFTRPDRYSSSYYYDSYRLTTFTSGLYSFRSKSSSFTDTYGCLYVGSFNPSYPSANKLICDDDSAGNLQFQFSQNLNSYNTYILVVTTSSSYSSGSYSVTVTGPASVSVTKTTPSVFPIPVAAIVCIVVGCVIFFVALGLSICIRRRRQQRLICSTTVPAQYNTCTLYPKI